MTILSFLLALLAIAGPRVIISKPVQYTTGEGQIVCPADAQIRVKVCDRQFPRETADLTEWSR